MMNRFAFQRECAQRVAGKILNVGCKEDPAEIKKLCGSRVVNMDLRDFDHDKWVNKGERVPIDVDVVHDATVAPWPFADDEFDLVILAEILEDLPDDGCQLIVLEEACRVGKRVCITTPQDTPERDWHHLTTVTEEKLKTWLDVTGWRVVEFNIVNYGFVPRGYFVFAKRRVPR